MFSRKKENTDLLTDGFLIKKKKLKKSRFFRLKSRTKSASFFKSLKQIFTNKDLVQRLFITILVFVVYRVLSAIPLPGINYAVYQEYFNSGSSNEANLLFTALTGGSLDSPSIVGLGIAAYIQASIIIQLLTPVIPKLTTLSKDGTNGKNILNQYTRFLTLPFSILYGFGYTVLLSRQDLSTGSTSTTGDFLIDKPLGSDWPTFTKAAFIILALTAGSMLVMWLSEMVTERGITNGSSLIIVTGILASIPSYIPSTFQNFSLSDSWNRIVNGDIIGLLTGRFGLILGLILGFIAMIVFVILINESTRKIKVQYSRGLTPGSDTNLPFKLAISGILPMYFSSVFLSVPSVILTLIQNFTDNSLVTKANDFVNSSFLVSANDNIANFDDVIYTLIYFILIVALGVFYAFLQVKPEDVSENLSKNAGFIPGIRPGKNTTEYIYNVVFRVAFIGSFLLGLVSLIPTVARVLIASSTQQNLLILSGVGGASLIIVTGAINETIRQFNSYKVTKSYSEYSDI